MPLALRPRPPYDFSHHLRIAARDPREPIDRVDSANRAWSRVFELEGEPVLVEVREAPGSTVDAPRLLVAASDPSRERAARDTVARVLSAREPGDALERAARGDAVMAALAQRQRGLKPLLLDGAYEALVWAVLGQQITLSFAFALKARLVARWGARAGDRLGFPPPRALARVSVDELRPLGFSRQKAAYLRAVAEAELEGRLDARALRGLDDEAAVAALRGIHGVGRWTAEYALLRGLGRADSLPAADVGLLNAAAAQYGLAPRPTEAGLRALAEAWRPVRGWGAVHLWYTLLPPAPAATGGGRLEDA